MSGSTIVPPSIEPTQMVASERSICANCGSDAPNEATHRIKDLETQVRLLNTKAAAAVDKLADYEDEVRSLRAAYTELQAQQHQTQPRPAPAPQPEQAANPPTPTTTPPILSNPSSPPRNPSRLASLTSFLPSRKRDTALLQQGPSTPSTTIFPQTTLFQSPSKTTSTSTTTTNTIPSDPLPNPPHATHAPSHQTTNDSTTSHPTLLSLQTSLETERTLRLRAESDLTQTQSELEELTATLFGQANEMVATERKARAKLEERVRVLEDRDGEKRRRLDRLEKALERIERVRGLVGGGGEQQHRVKNAFTGVALQVNGPAGVEDPARLRVVNVADSSLGVVAVKA